MTLTNFQKCQLLNQEMDDVLFEDTDDLERLVDEFGKYIDL